MRLEICPSNPRYSPQQIPEEPPQPSEFVKIRFRHQPRPSPWDSRRHRHGDTASPMRRRLPFRNNSTTFGRLSRRSASSRNRSRHSALRR